MGVWFDMAEHWSIEFQEQHGGYGYDCPLCHPRTESEIERKEQLLNRRIKANLERRNAEARAKAKEAGA